MLCQIFKSSWTQIRPASNPWTAASPRIRATLKKSATMQLLVVACIGIVSLILVDALDNGLGMTPPMGFNTWNYFGCNINETVIKSAADKLISLGLAGAGYTYLNLDDCWHTRTRAANGQLEADPVKFPSGMVDLGDYIHSRGLKFGIYSDAGLFTCAGYPGSRFHEQEDAELFASWGIDYLKYDNCFAASVDVKERYLAMRDALNATGRPIFYSMCEWGVNDVWTWARPIGNSWRTEGDIAATWNDILRSLDNGAVGLAKYAGPGGWNDPDMLEVGNGLLSIAQQRSHFALWCLVKAPLLIGANLELLQPDSLDILLNEEVIAINQDRLGVAGDIIWKEGPKEVWAAPLDRNTRAVILFNRHHAGNPVNIRVTWKQLGYKDACSRNSTASRSSNKCKPFKARVRDLYARKDLGVFESGYTASVLNFDVAVLKVTPVVEPSASGDAVETTWRPWEDPAAAQLQQRLRDAAVRRKQFLAFLDKLWSLIKQWYGTILEGLVVVAVLCALAWAVRRAYGSNAVGTRFIVSDWIGRKGPQGPKYTRVSSDIEL